MRVYVGGTPQVLADALHRGELGATLPAHAVTPALRAQVRGAAAVSQQPAHPQPAHQVDEAAEEEDAEYAALLDAARSSLLLLAEPAADADRAGPPCRVVFAADVEAAGVEVAGMGPATSGLAASAVALTRPVPLAAVVSAHVDEQASSAFVRRAVDALQSIADADADANADLERAVAEIEDADLLWYDAGELQLLSEELRSRGD